MLELIVLKTALVFHQFYRVRLLPRADLMMYRTLCSVCKEWRGIMTNRKYNRRQLRRTFQQKVSLTMLCLVFVNEVFSVRYLEY